MASVQKWLAALIHTLGAGQGYPRRRPQAGIRRRVPAQGKLPSNAAIPPQEGQLVSERRGCSYCCGIGTIGIPSNAARARYEVTHGRFGFMWNEKAVNQAVRVASSQ